MTIRDSWLLERAHQKKVRAAQPPRLTGAALMAGHPVGELWSMLQKETVRQAAVYTSALGDPGEVVVETTADEIRIRMRDGRESTIRIDREQAALSETFRNQGGGVRVQRPNIRFLINADGKLALNYGLHASAGSLLRRLIG
jgi:hypothetical protein